MYKNISTLQQFPPTPLGFYDMITDNLEWMLDWYDPEYYSKSPEKNPQGPKTGTLKVVRSFPPSDGQSLRVFGGKTMQRHSMHYVHYQFFHYLLHKEYIVPDSALHIPIVLLLVSPSLN